MDFNINIASTANPNELYDLIIIGGGPAGLTAGLYAARYKLKTVMLEKMAVSGGQLTSTEWVENYPGFPEPVLGQKLARDMETQARQFGLQIINETVTEVNLAGKVKDVHTPYAVWQAKTILICTGSTPRKLNIPGENEFRGNGVSYCATCDGPFYPDKTIAVVGGGNTAFEETQFLARYAAKVYIIHRTDNYRADKILQERARQNAKLELLPFHQVTKIDFNNPEGRRIFLQKTKETVGAGTIPALETRNDKPYPYEKGLPVDGIFIFIGNDPNTGLFTGQLQMENGYIVADQNHQTSVEGVWAAGDVQAGALRQIATAVGDGAEAAYWINKYLESRSD